MRTRTKITKQPSLFGEPKPSKPGKLTQRELAVIIRDKGETQYTGPGSLMTTWALAVLK